MEQFTEKHSTCLLGKEWLAKTDNQTSTPYLFKFYSSMVDLSCCVLLTDTKSVWAEVLTSNQFARRWRDCHPESIPPLAEPIEEYAWRAAMLELLSSAHTLGGITDASFEDFAFKLEWDKLNWKWETCFLGHKFSSEIISKHLIFPLISVNHLAFSSADAVGAMLDADVEKTVDKVGRIARRTVDTHVKNAISKPRVASAIQRMTAILNFIPDLPSVISTAGKPDLLVESQVTKVGPSSKIPTTLPSIPQQPRDQKEFPLDEISVDRFSPNVRVHANSATESEGDDSLFPDGVLPTSGSSALNPPAIRVKNTSRSNPTSRASPMPSASEPGTISESTSSPVRPAKKFKKQVASSSGDSNDSEAERRRRVAQIKSGTGPVGVKRGTKQPIKRGGKRF